MKKVIARFIGWLCIKLEISIMVNVRIDKFGVNPVYSKEAHGRNIDIDSALKSIYNFYNWHNGLYNCKSTEENGQAEKCHFYNCNRLYRCEASGGQRTGFIGEEINEKSKS
jgi:hypothetical protein